MLKEDASACQMTEADQDFWKRGGLFVDLFAHQFSQILMVIKTKIYPILSVFIIFAFQRGYPLNLPLDDSIGRLLWKKTFYYSTYSTHSLDPNR